MPKYDEAYYENKAFMKERGSGSFKAYCTKRLIKEKYYGPKSMFVCIEDRYTPGIADILGLYDGLFIAIELKVKNNKASVAQNLFLSLVRKAKGVSGIAYNWGQVKAIIQEAIDRVEKT